LRKWAYSQAVKIVEIGGNMNWWRLGVLVAVVISVIALCEGKAPSPSAGQAKLEPEMPDADQARGACTLFVPRQYPDADLTNEHAWTVVDNKDGSFSVGARYFEPTSQGRRARYTTCIVRRSGNVWRLESMARLL
jgi:hypothetical protein